MQIDLERDGVFNQTINTGKEFHIKKTNLAYEGDISGFFDDEIFLKAKLTDENGNPIPNKEIFFTLETQSATSTIDENGIAITTLEINLIPKELIEIHPLTIVFPGNNEYLVSKVKIDFTLKSAKSLKQEVVNELKSKGIIVKCQDLQGIAEEAPMAYKNIDEVVEIVHKAGLSKKVVKLKPLAVIKGE